jgi:hypothetical protein
MNETHNLHHLLPRSRGGTKKRGGWVKVPKEFTIIGTSYLEI